MSHYINPIRFYYEKDQADFKKQGGLLEGFECRFLDKSSVFFLFLVQYHHPTSLERLHSFFNDAEIKEIGSLSFENVKEREKFCRTQKKVKIVCEEGRFFLRSG